MKIKPLLIGISTFIPGFNPRRVKRTGGTDSARYCYSVWLRHLVMAKKNGLDPCPKVIAELGPGDSLGIGLAALISGCENYFAFDVVEYASVERNARIFEELVRLFTARTPIPGEDELPNVKPYLEKYDFPGDILNEVRLRHALETSRLEKIRDSIRHFRHKDSWIQYKAPWWDTRAVTTESVNMIYSQAVLEHVDDLKETYRLMHSYLKPNGYISHQIDFKCHGTADEWNGHWTYSDILWKLIRGKRVYLLNREPHSTHIAAMMDAGFKVLCDQTVISPSRLTMNELASRFRSMSSDDLTTSGAFIQAAKKDECGGSQKDSTCVSVRTPA